MGWFVCLPQQPVWQTSLFLFDFPALTQCLHIRHSVNTWLVGWIRQRKGVRHSVWNPACAKAWHVVRAGAMRNPMGPEHTKTNGEADWPLQARLRHVETLPWALGTEEWLRLSKGRRTGPERLLGTPSVLVGLETGKRALRSGNTAVPEFRLGLGATSPPCSRHFSRSWGHSGQQ